MVKLTAVNVTKYPTIRTFRYSYLYACNTLIVGFCHEIVT